MFGFLGFSQVPFSDLPDEGILPPLPPTPSAVVVPSRGLVGSSGSRGGYTQPQEFLPTSWRMDDLFGHPPLTGHYLAPPGSSPPYSQHPAWVAQEEQDEEDLLALLDDL